MDQGHRDEMGENQNLSLGQKKIIGVLRALLRSPKILLLDEITSKLSKCCICIDSIL